MAKIIKLTIDGITTDVTSSVISDSLKLSYSLFKDLTPTTNRADFRLLGKCSIIPDLLETQNDVVVEIKEGSTYLFYGYLTDNLSWQINTTGNQPISLSAEDPGIKKLKKTWVSANSLCTIYSNLAICNPLDTANSILHKICTLAGVTVDSSIPTISSTLSLIIQDKDNKTYWDVLQTISYEYGYTFYFTEDGKLNLYKIAKADLTPATSFSTSTNIIVEGDQKGISTQKKIQQYKQVNVTWDEWETKTDLYVFRDSTGGNNNWDCYIPLAPGAYYPSGADANTYVFPEYETENGQEIINVNSATADYVVDSGITVEFENLGTRGKLRIHNASASTTYIRKLKIKANSVVLVKNKNTTTAGESITPILKYEAKYIHDSATATNFANTLKSYYKYSNYTYTFKSRVNVNLGTVVTLVDPQWSNLNILVLVTGKEVKENGLIAYTATGIDTFSLADTVRRDISLRSNNNIGEVTVPQITTPTITIGTTEVTLGGSTTSLDGISVTGTVSGNAETATKLAIPRTIGLSGKVAGTATAFDGSSPITINTTALSVSSSEVVDATNLNTPSVIVKRDASGNFSAGTITAALLGTASLATKLATARTIALSGKITAAGTVFDGSQNITITTTAASILSSEVSDSTNANTANMIVKRDASGGFSAGAISATSLSTTGDVTVGGNLTVNGSTTTLNATTLTVDDKNIEMGSVASPTDITANGGGITLKGTTDKTIQWDSTTTNWTSSEYFNLLTGKSYKINNTVVLSENTLGTGIINSSLTSVGTLTNLTVTNTIIGSISGNAGTATKLQNIRTIAGVSFDGTSNIAIPFANLTSKPISLSGYGITDGQPLDADLTAIAGLTGTTGFLKKTAADTWALDTNTYITGNQNITISGDATGSGTTSIALTLSNSGVTAGTYKSLTVDSKGRVIGGTNPSTLSEFGITDAATSTHTHTFTSLTSLPSSISGFGILDGVTLTGSQTLSNKTIAAGSNNISGLTNSNLSGSAGITNANLANSSITIGTTTISLGASSTSLAGLTSVTSTSFVGALSGNASSASAVSVTADNTSTTFYPLFISGSTSANYTPKVYSSLSFNPSTGNLTTTTFTGSFSGNASSATKLATARTISITGKVVGSATSFDGSANISITTTALGVLSSDVTDATSANTASMIVKRDSSGNFSAGTISATSFVGTLSTAAQGSITSLGTLTGLTVAGSITQTGANSLSNSFVSGALGTGWKLDYNSSVANKSYFEVDNLLVRDTFRTHEFQKDTIKAFNGQIYVSDSGIIADNYVGSNTIYFDADKSATFAVNDVIKIKDVNLATGQPITLIKVTISSVGALSGGKQAYVVTLNSGSLSDIQKGMTAVKVSSGAILLDASSTYNPYIDVLSNEVVKTRIGKLDGISGCSGYGLYSDNVFLTGTITATSGKFGNWNISANSLYAGGYDSSGNNPDNLQGTYLASNGSILANTATFKNITIEGDSQFTGTIDTPVLKAQFINEDLPNWVAPTGTWSGELLYQHFLNSGIYRLVPCTGTFNGLNVSYIQRGSDHITIFYNGMNLLAEIYRADTYTYQGNIDATVEGRLQTISLTPLDYQENVYTISGYKSVSATELKSTYLFTQVDGDCLLQVSYDKAITLGGWGSSFVPIDLVGEVTLKGAGLSWTSTASWTGSSFCSTFARIREEYTYCLNSTFDGYLVYYISRNSTNGNITLNTANGIYTIVNDSTAYTYQGSVTASSSVIVQTPLRIISGLYSYNGTYPTIELNYFGNSDSYQPHLMVQPTSIRTVGNQTNINLNLTSKGTGYILLNSSDGGNVGIGVVTPTQKLDVYGSIKATGSFISTVTTGTAPLAVSSTTRVDNLNADLLEGMHAGYSSTANTVVSRDANGDFSARYITATTFTGALAGNSSTSTKLASARTISISTGVTGTATSFDGSANITIPVTSVAASYLSGTIPSAVLGNSTIYIGTTAVALNRTSSALVLTGITSIDGSASKLTTARTIAGVSFDGTANISIPFANLSSLPTTLSGYSISDATPSSHVGATGTAHGAVTTSVNGFMSAADKSKLDGIATGANNYSLPISTASVLGGVKIGSGVSVDANGVISVSTSYQAPLSGTGLVKSTAGVISYDTNTYITGNQTITVSGDATGSGTTSIALTLSNSGVTAGTYKSVTVDSKGRVTAGSNFTTLSGAGITDAAPLSHVGATGTAHGVVTTSINGFMSATDKTKLDGIDTGANNYVHPSGDGNLHVPVTGTTNNQNVLKAGGVAGSIAWGTIAFSEIQSKPNTLEGYGIGNALPLTGGTLTGALTAPSFNASSKRALKENINTYNNSAFSVLNKVKVVSFNFKADSTKENRIGFIADDTPSELSGTNHDKMDLANTVGLLIKAVQELKAENEELKKKVKYV